MTKPETTLPLREIARRLDNAGITWAVFAGAAASVYGATHPLTDVDILVPTAEGDRVTALFPEAQLTRCEDGSIPELGAVGPQEAPACPATRGPEAAVIERADSVQRRVVVRHIGGLGGRRVPAGVPVPPAAGLR